MREARRSPEPAAAVEQLLEASWAGRQRPIRGRELRVELGVTAGFLLVVAVLLATAPEAPAPHAAVVGALVLAYALAARVEFPIGAAYFVPTQLFLVPLFALAPAALVPALVFVAFVLAAAGAAVVRRAAFDRVVFSAGDAAHALGPAIVFVVFADGDATQASVAVIALAFAAQLVADLVSSSLHETLIMGARPDVHLSMLPEVWTVDLALGSVGLLAAWVAQTEPWAALAPAAAARCMLKVLAADRAHSIASAHERLRALEQERGRRQAAAQLLERHTQFLQDVSHQLRTPLTIARGHLELLRRTGGAGAGVRARAGRARPDGADDRAPAPARPGREPRLARAHAARRRRPAGGPVRALVGRDPAGRGGSRSSAAAPSSGMPTPSDGALDALIENAVKHTGPGQSITLRSRAQGDVLEIQVADEGPGIPPEDLRAHLQALRACRHRCRPAARRLRARPRDRRRGGEGARRRVHGRVLAGGLDVHPPPAGLRARPEQAPAGARRALSRRSSGERAPVERRVGGHPGGEALEVARVERLRAVAQRALGVVVDLDDHAVGAGRDGGRAQRRDQLAVAGGVAGVDDHRQMGVPLEPRHGGEVAA